MIIHLAKTLPFVFQQAVNKEIRDLKARMQTLFDEKEQMQTENQELTKRKAKLELIIKDIQEELEGDEKAKVSCYGNKM